ncbi:MAG: tRNA (N(6)-L-threonylcarbamoyladenosine(37)-C(2))-methylthiotransferase MtaB [Alphaproteobacteria bacterium]|jgi:threonylcarbamoyladenosine tRNA methylthiotransferase MtaB
MTAKPEIVTFGCRLNAFESEAIRELAEGAGRDNLIVVNTCAVTAEAERQARQTIRKLRRERPDAEILVTGCAAQISPDTYAAMPEVSRVVGNREKLQAETYGGRSEERVRVDDIMSVRETANHLISGFGGRARAFVQVQNGCDHRCTFCIIPYGRGNSRSVPAGEVVEQIRTLVEGGVKEVVLSGVDITSYGADLPGQPSLGLLVRRILKLVPELPRLRISSIDCIEMDPDLIRAVAEEERLMPHLHLSLQAGDDMILKRMKRRHSRDDAIRLTDTLRAMRPDIVFGADLIAGFPTETDAMFDNTLRIVEECGLTWLHVFPYSERPGTPAARIPNQVPKADRKARAKALRDAGARAEAAYLARLDGGEAVVLIEQDNSGHSEGFAPVRFPGQVQDGSLIRARLRTGRDGSVTGTALAA